MWGKRYFEQEVLLTRILADLRSWTGEDFNAVIGYLERELTPLELVDFPPQINAVYQLLIETIRQQNTNHRNSSFEITSRHNLVLNLLHQLLAVLGERTLADPGQE